MSKKTKKAMSMLLVVTLIAVIAVGGMLAYLTSESSDVNVMTLGKVKIEQIEQQRATDGTLELFKDNKPAYPAVGPIEWADEGVTVNGTEYKVFTDDLKNVVDKIVTVNNIGISDAYIRTIVAIEAPNGDPNNLIHINWNGTDTELITKPVTKIDGVDYYIAEFVYKNPLAAGAKSAPSLMQVFLDSKATNEDVAKFGDTWEILVLSQAAQTNGFADAQTALDTAFGKTEENAAEWFKKVLADAEPKGDDDSVTYTIPEGTEYTTVSSTEELKTALNNEAAVILLKDGEYNWSGTGHNGTSQTVSIYGESKNAVLYHTHEGESNTDYDFDGYTVNFYGLTISGEKNGASYPGWARMSATYNDCVIKQTYGLYAGTHEFNYCTLNVTGDQYNIWTWGAENATFDNCTFNSDGKAVLLYGQANTKLTVNNCVFNDNGGLTDLKAAIEIGNDYGKSYELIVNNTTVNGYEINDKGINTGTTLWGNKNSMGKDKLNVLVDGVDIY